ncbi:recombinase family protein [Nesterenkonia marinintestina]|uniref:recombinase family protein n=1 Tax=Nesterenkonia marinintestina TaxID=2979865 RepID=UPI0021C12850|nr:recombinase family protein [Nesterenkonia sp. GX14115]
MRAAIYTRLSYDRHGDELGVKRQEEDCRAIVERRGWNLIGVYTDNSVSAYKDSVTRPGYEQLRQDYVAGKFNALVTFDLDRLTRQPRQLEDWIDAAEKHGLALVTANGEADLTTVNGRTFARTKAAFSRGEIEMKSFRQKRAAKQRAELGKPWGVERPFGYQADKVTPEPREAEAVRQLFTDFLAGTPQHQLARQLNAAGILTTRGNQWTQGGVRRVLLNPRYAGLAQHKGELTGTEAQWPALVPRETWEASVSKMRHRRVGPGHNRVKYLLSTVAECGVCGAGLRSKNRRDKVRYYTCPSLGHVSRKADNLDEMVTRFILSYIQRHGLAAAPQSNAPDRDALVEQADVLRQREVQLGTEFADGELTAAQLRAANERLQERLGEIHEQLAASSMTPGLESLTDADDIRAAWDALDLHRRRGVVKALVRVVVQPHSKPGSKEFIPADVKILPKA